MNLSLPVAAILLLFTTACEKEDDYGTGALPPPPNTSIYPLVVGHKWTYYKEMSMEDSLIYQGYCIQSIDSMYTLPNSSSTFAIGYKDSTAASMYFTGTQFYNATSTGLYHYGTVYGATGGVYLLPEPRRYYSAGNMRFNSLEELFRILKTGRCPVRADSIVIYTPPKLVMKNPLVLNDEWIYTTQAFLIKRKYVGDEVVHTAFGNFTCRKLVWFYDIDGDGNLDNTQMTEYISPTKGLLKEVFDVEIVTYDNNGNVIGIGMGRDESIAVSINF
jgi:hypothetical protein